MSEQLYVCRDKDDRCPLRCKRMGPFERSDFIVSADGNIRFAEWDCLRGNRKDDVVCIPYTPEPELRICSAKKDERCNSGCAAGHDVPHEQMDSCKADRCLGTNFRSLSCVPYQPQSPKEQPMYELIKSVSIKALEQTGMPERELHRLCYLFLKEYSGSYSYSYEWALTPVLKCAEKCEGGMAFLVEHGFVREKERTLPDLRLRKANDNCYFIETSNGDSCLLKVTKDGIFRFHSVRPEYGFALEEEGKIAITSKF